MQDSFLLEVVERGEKGKEVEFFQHGFEIAYIEYQLLQVETVYDFEVVAEEDVVRLVIFCCVGPEGGIEEFLLQQRVFTPLLKIKGDQEGEEVLDLFILDVGLMLLVFVVMQCLCQLVGYLRRCGQGSSMGEEQGDYIVLADV